MLDQTVCIFAHLEEIRFFLRRLYFTAAVRTFAVNQLRFGKERLAGSTVHTFIISFIDITFIIQLFENLLHLSHMIFIRSTNKFIIRSIHQIPDRLNLTCYSIHKFLRSYTSSLSFFFNLLSMLICTGLETYIISLCTFISGNRIRQHDFISISNMRFA